MNTSMTTINISLPKLLYNGAKKRMVLEGYASISEYIRDAIREKKPSQITVNGFTPEFEAEVLKAAAEPRKNDIAWNGKGSFTKFVLREGKKRYGKG